MAEQSIDEIKKRIKKQAQAVEQNIEAGNGSELEVEETSAEDLKTELERVKAELEVLKSRQTTSGVGGGWIVTCQNPKYSGKTAGVQFRAGQAFVREQPGSEKIISILVSDFGYTAKKVDNLENQSLEMQESTDNNLVNVLATPQYMK